MEYTDNPRKILGRVDVIYSDTEISKDIQTTESGNSAISHPDEVFGAYLVQCDNGRLLSDDGRFGRSRLVERFAVGK